jgi:phosphoribosylformylglycinamidine synthase
LNLGIIVFPGSNCDSDCLYVFRDILSVNAFYIWHKDKDLKNADIIILPGGFSYGDYLKCGAIAKLSPAMELVYNFATNGGYVLGICNGFQILVEMGLLPGALLRNRDLKFICKSQYIKCINENTAFTCNLEGKNILNIPIAHKAGNYFIDEVGLKDLYRFNQVIFKYCDEKGIVNSGTNPNGSIDNIAGITNKKGNVLGMMPHPERAAESILGSEDGLKICTSIIKTIK